MEDLRYPIGQYTHTGPISDEEIAGWIADIEALPAQLRAAVEGLTAAQLDTPYRPGGWTVRQVVHHIGDSHMNCLVRFKWTLTEDIPTIKPYDEVRWAELPDYQAVPIETSLVFIAHLHARWITLLRALSRVELARTFVHPDSGESSLAWNLGNYAWHGRHHVAHITNLRARKGW